MLKYPIVFSENVDSETFAAENNTTQEDAWEWLEVWEEEIQAFRTFSILGVIKIGGKITNIIQLEDDRGYVVYGEGHWVYEYNLADALATAKHQAADAAGVNVSEVVVEGIEAAPS